MYICSLKSHQQYAPDQTARQLQRQVCHQWYKDRTEPERIETPIGFSKDRMRPGSKHILLSSDLTRQDSIRVG